MVLSSTHPGITTHEVQRETGWLLKIADDVQETPSPSKDEIVAVRKYDPKGVWTS